jgi:hypothetical protein
LVPDLDLASKKCQSDLDCATGQHCDSSGVCAQSVDACLLIPHFTGTQIVDGDGTEFAGIPEYTVDRVTGTTIGAFEPDKAGNGIALTARVAWSDQGLHLFFHVEDDATGLVVPTGTDMLYFGDGIELFFKADAHLTGAYDGSTKDPGAIQVILVPPSAAMSLPARTGTFASFGNVSLGAFDARDYAFKVSPTGYDLEAQLPWTLPLAASPTPAAGAHIGLDFAVDYHTRVGSPDNAYQLLLADQTPPDALCMQEGQGGPHPSCDDRTWCSPQLAP